MRFPELENLQHLCDVNGFGFFFEEGGCWGMAKALYDYFRSKGASPTYRVQLDFVHCYVEVDGLSYDYTGAVPNPPFCSPTTEEGFYALAAKYGVDAEELEHDTAIAADMIEACSTLNEDPLMESAGMTLVLWHGGRGLQSDYMEIRSHKKGRWEHGPGIYLTDHRETASKYAKGGGSVYQVTIEIDPAHECGNVAIDIKDAIVFVKRNVVGRLKQQVIDDLHASFNRRGELTAEIMINLCLNWEAIPNTKTEALRYFLIDQGVQYTKVTRYGGRDETLYVVVNPKIIKDIKVVRANEGLTEGLIKYPQSVYDKAMSFIAKNVLSWAATNFGMTEEIQNLANHFGCQIDLEYPEIGTKPTHVEYVDMEPEMDGYPALSSPERIAIAVNWKKNAPARGQWMLKHKAIAVFPFSSGVLNDFPRNYFALGDILEELEVTLRHEIRHAVQFLYLKDHPEQSEKRYSDSNDDKTYYTSPVEFGPMIGSEVDDFMQYYWILRGYGKKPNVRRMIMQTTGMAKDMLGNPPSKLFTVLKKEAPVRYREAVKKFTSEVMKMIADQEKEFGKNYPQGIQLLDD